ncbi:hypothetical protein [Candidatus Binatus sp.]|uniref:hypothetical protein n=1 Tax=Candidatus Binatus sp. TaxID=2811406 RepID=UPI003BB130A0
MDKATLTNTPRACTRNDLRTELNKLWRRNHSVYQGRESEGPIVLGDIWVQLDDDPSHRGYYEGASMYRRAFDRLVEHERRFGRISRTSEEDRYESGLVVLDDNSWPFCSECLLPFVTVLNGYPRSGVWVERIEDGADLCGCCWLDDHYAGDHDRMIEHVIRHDLGDEMAQASLRADIRRGVRAGRVSGDHGMALRELARAYFDSPGLFELLRLHRVAVREAAAVIWRTINATLAEVQAQAQARRRLALTRRDKLWRSEQRESAHTLASRPTTTNLSIDC